MIAGSAAARGAEPIDYNRDIRPIISGTCASCHGPDPDTREAGLRLDTSAGATEDLGGYAAIVPGDPDASELILRVESEDEGLRMPPPGHGERLTDDQIDLLRRWIREGAGYQRHWSYVVPEKAALPPVSDRDWPRQPLDHFILRRLEDEGLQPSPAADRAALARRVSLALVGLPPTTDQLQNFLADPHPDAYEHYVDKLLASPAYGERWARVWLDLARYADSAGYADDPARTIWAYRDYVIRSFNQNKPFDQFTIEQIAGDLLENPTDEQLIATAFHRNTMTNNEGGTNDEQFRNEAVVDRVNTTMAVWMGTTMACAQCHTHKYDPITQKEYFQFFDFFNQTADADRRDERPVLEVFTATQKQQQQELRDRIAGLTAQLEQETPQLDAARDQWLESLQQPPAWRPLAVDKAELQAESAETRLAITEGEGVRLEGPLPQTATYQLDLPLDGSQPLTAMQLAVSAQQQGNFVLSGVELRWEPRTEQPVSGRFVRIELPGERRILHLAEVEVFSGAENLARGSQARQSSTGYDAVATRAVDGDTSGDFFKGSVTHCETEDNPWWEVDLGQTTTIDQVVLWNRTDGGTAIQSRLQGYQISILDSDRRVVWSAGGQTVDATKLVHGTGQPRDIRFVAAQADFHQPNFPPSAVLNDGSAADDSGWAIGGAIGRPHQLTLFLAEALPAQPGRLVLTLEQQSKFPQHVLSNFRINGTADPQVLRWAEIPGDLRLLLSKSDRSAAEQRRVDDYFRSVTPLLEQPRRELQKAREALASIKPQTTVPIMRQQPAAQRRDTYVQLRGNYQSLGEQVSAGVPDAFHDLPEGRPADRLALAQWLVSRENPLTARVLVNRYWEQLFGAGLVETSEEFGSQGSLPSHPELLDWLAVDLVEHNWDLKRLLKQIVMSATYRQSSRVTPELLEADPDNRLYARGPRFRISAEMIRDQALHVAGLLSEKMYGPPVRPPQPNLGLSAAFGSKTDWQTSEGEDRYRRGIYTLWRRSNPYPSMATFDAPNREVCTIRRSRTNTPLQALVTLNDPVYVEAAQALARRASEISGGAERVAHLFELALSRPPNSRELQHLEELRSRAKTLYRERPAAARAMATQPLGESSTDGDLAELAALTVVANVVLNLDEMVMPR